MYVYQKSIWKHIVLLIISFILIYIAHRTLSKSVMNEPLTKSTEQSNITKTKPKEFGFLSKVIGFTVVFPIILVHDIVPDLIVRTFRTFWRLLMWIKNKVCDFINSIWNAIKETYYYLKPICIKIYNDIIVWVYDNWEYYHNWWASIIDAYWNWFTKMFE